jgi:hypothetical protein
MREVFIIGILLTQVLGLFSQGHLNNQDTTVAKGPEYFFFVQSGTLVGCNDCSKGRELSFTAATVHGIKIGKRLRLGGGLGFDSYYEWNIMPAFGSISWDIISRKNSFFVQLNYGGSLKSWKNSPYEEYGYQGSEGGSMLNPMVGYRLRYHDLSISLIAGYKYQRVTSSFEYPYYYWDPVQGQIIGEPSTSTVIQEMNRFMLSMSIGWK